MHILGIETSCDESSCAIVENGRKILSNVVVSSLKLHAKTGGIIPEIAARQQIRYILPVIKQTLKEADLDFLKIDALAVTIGPGLIGSLLVGVETAKTLAFVWQKPIVPVNHLIGHIYANWLITSNEQQLTTNKTLAVRSQQLEVVFPAIVLIVSGGHTDLLLMGNHGELKWLGGTLDDAAGELFDKVGRLLNLPYPGGPNIEKMAKNGNPKAFNFPRPLIGSSDFNFSFSGLKTAVLQEVQVIKELARRSLGEGGLNNETISNISASVQQAVIEVLVKKTLKAAEKHNVKSILLSGGVSANELLRKTLEVSSQKLKVKFFAPAKNLCTDNASMIASAAFFNYEPVSWKQITANPELYFN